MPPKSRLGQNFLRDEGAVARMVASLGDISDATVLEIGPGHGALTFLLAEKAKKLIAVEVDPELANELRVSFRNHENFTLIERSILAVDFAEIAQGEKLVVIGNLPYYITSEILLHILDQHQSIQRAVLMVQREVAERVTAEPGSRDYGLLTVTVALHAGAEELFTLPPQAFVPPPQVHSTVFRLHIAPRFEELGVEPEAFIGFLRRCFVQKRKTLTNNLRSAGYAAAAIEASMAKAAVPLKARAETLELTRFAALFKALEQN
jgi:16S rRNA (adenine1518-N6/adenine1519-N6)-dimethyltransferase